MLGIFSKNRPQSNKRLHFLLCGDLIKLEAISKEARLLGENHIDTAGQFSLYQAGLEKKVQALTPQHQKLYKSQGTVRSAPIL